MRFEHRNWVGGMECVDVDHERAALTYWTYHDYWVSLLEHNDNCAIHYFIPFVVNYKLNLDPVNLE